MRTRRSRKSFEVISPKKRNRRNGQNNNNKPLSLNVANKIEETIILSDSEPESEIVTILPDLRVRETVDDDIQVIDVADETQEIENVEETETDKKAIEQRRSIADPEPDTDQKPSSVNISRSSVSSSSAVTLPCVDEPPIVNLDEDSHSAPNDDDGVEFLGFVVTGSNKQSTSNKRKRPSLVANRKSNGNLQIMQECIKRAKNTMRRSSSTNSVSPVPRWDRGALLNSVAPVSKKIRRNKKKNKNKHNFRNPQMHNGFRPAQPWNALNRNRFREHAREVIFRPLAEPHTSVIAPGCSNPTRNPWISSNKRFPVPTQRAGPPATIPVGSNIMVASDASPKREPGSLRPIVIDGSNIAIGHGDTLQIGGQKFSPRGIQICVDYFRKRGHKEVIAFVPRFRQKQNQSIDPKLLETLERDGCVRFTPSREAGPHRIASYDDMFVIQYAHETGGIIISNDNFRDIYGSNPQLQETITLRQLMFTWVTPDVIMFPQDPLGANGPTLDAFLKF